MLSVFLIVVQRCLWNDIRGSMKNIRFGWLSVGSFYRVYAIQLINAGLDVLVLDEGRRPHWFPIELLIIHDGKIPHDWEFRLDTHSDTNIDALWGYHTMIHDRYHHYKIQLEKEAEMDFHAEVQRRETEDADEV